jgi:hypothetical protein
LELHPIIIELDYGVDAILGSVKKVDEGQSDEELVEIF